MKNAVAVCCIAILATACGTVEKVAIDPGTTTAMRGKTVVRTTRVDKPVFGAMTAGNGAFAVLGAMAGLSAGTELIKKNNVPVPDDAIGSALGAQLQATRGMRFIDTPVTVATGDVGPIVAAAKGKADYVLDVQTVSWQFIYFPMSWRHYKVLYRAKARVIDVATEKVVAQGTCARDPAYSESAPTYDQLMDNQAAGLKKELVTAGNECVASLQRDILAL